jgi:hypothetical protein
MTKFSEGSGQDFYQDVRGQCEKKNIKKKVTIMIKVGQAGLKLWIFLHVS